VVQVSNLLVPPTVEAIERVKKGDRVNAVDEFNESKIPKTLPSLPKRGPGDLRRRPSTPIGAHSNPKSEIPIPKSLFQFHHATPHFDNSKTRNPHA
jgi:hypothetical protein